MNAIARAALLLLALPACAPAQTTQQAVRISGSIFPTVIRPGSLQPPKPSSNLRRSEVAPDTQGIVAVCLTSKDHAKQCQARMDAVYAERIAFCDVEDIGLRHCLARHAAALVKQPAAAARTFRLTVRDAQGTSDTVIVLAASAQSDAEIAKAALEGRPNGSVVALETP